MAHAADAVLRFHFDYVSHNAWLAWARLLQIAPCHGLLIEPVPVVFGAMLKAHGQLGPAEIAPKRDWMLRNVRRKAALYGIPLAPPHSHPFNPLLALRLSCGEFAPASRERLVTALFRAAWVERRPLQDAATLREVLQGLGEDADARLAEAQAEAVKARLRANTEAALAEGLFGVPAMVVRGESFWGFDDLEHLERFLEGREPLAPDAAADAAWAAVRPSVERRRDA